jgi:hypothetical protein
MTKTGSAVMVKVKAPSAMVAGNRASATGNTAKETTNRLTPL